MRFKTLFFANHTFVFHCWYQIQQLCLFARKRCIIDTLQNYTLNGQWYLGTINFSSDIPYFLCCHYFTSFIRWKCDQSLKDWATYILSILFIVESKCDNPLHYLQNDKELRIIVFIAWAAHLCGGSSYNIDLLCNYTPKQEWLSSMKTSTKYMLHQKW